MNEPQKRDTFLEPLPPAQMADRHRWLEIGRKEGRREIRYAMLKLLGLEDSTIFTSDSDEVGRSVIVPVEDDRI